MSFSRDATRKPRTGKFVLREPRVWARSRISAFWKSNLAKSVTRASSEAVVVADSGRTRDDWGTANFLTSVSDEILLVASSRITWAFAPPYPNELIPIGELAFVSSLIEHIVIPAGVKNDGSLFLFLILRNSLGQLKALFEEA